MEVYYFCGSLTNKGLLGDFHCLSIVFMWKHARLNHIAPHSVNGISTCSIVRVALGTDPHSDNSSIRSVALGSSAQ